MEINTVHHTSFLNNTLPEKAGKLIIADPPYFEVKGYFDFIWKSFDDYLADVEKWAAECKRLLADNGTLFWYGNAKKIAYTQMILDKHFDLINSLVWNKGSFMGLEESEGIRSFAPCTERILMYGNETTNLTQSVFHIRNYVRGEIEKAKGRIVLKEINEALGTATNGGGRCFSLSQPGENRTGNVNKRNVRDPTKVVYAIYAKELRGPTIGIRKPETTV